MEDPKKYLWNKPSDEAVSSRKLNGDPFVAEISRSMYSELQKDQKANIFHERIKEAGCWTESYYRHEDPIIAMCVFHTDHQILHDLMEEFVPRAIVKAHSWKKLKHRIVG